MSRLGTEESRETLSLGPYTIHRIPDIDGIAWPVTALLGAATDEDLDRLAPDLPRGHLQRAARSLLISFNPYLVIGPGCTVLIDAGVGNDKERPDRPAWHRRRGNFIQALGGYGVGPGDVTHVINTHLHADHVGWNTCLVGGEWRPTFPNARYIVPRKEFAFWSARHDACPDEPILHGAFADSVFPVAGAGQIELVDLPSEPLAGFRMEPAFGHAPGMAVVWLHTPEGKVAFTADAFHHSLQCGAPELSSNFCLDKEQSARTRRSLLETLAVTGALVAPYHFAPPSLGRVVRSGPAYAFVPLTRA